MFCGARVSPEHAFCGGCGTAQPDGSSPPSASAASQKAVSHAPQRASRPRVRISQGVLALAWIAVLTWSAFYPEYAMTLFVLSGPLLLASICPLVRSTRLSGWVENQETRLRARLASAEDSDGRFARYFFRPLYRGSLWIWSATRRIPDPHLRAGLRAAAVLYFSGAMACLGILAGYVVLMGVLLVIAAIISLLLLALAFWVWSASVEAEEHSVDVKQYREGYNAGRSAAAGPLPAFDLLAMLRTEEYVRGFQDGHQKRPYSP